MAAQFIRTPAGEEMAVMPRAEYEALLGLAGEAAEDAADVAAYDAAMTDKQGAHRLPFEVSQAILKGAGLLRALREYRHLGQARLASDSGLSQGFISDLETGRRKMTADVALRIAETLDVPVDWLKPVGG